MSSEHLASAKNTLKGNLGGNWNILDGASGQYQDLGVARRFGGAAAAYSLRDIGAMNGPVVRVRREPHDTDATINDEADFSASQVASGSLEDWVNGKQETTLPADVATAAAAYSLRKVKADYSGNAVRIRRSSDDIEVDVAFDLDDKVSASSTITNVAEQGGESGQTTDTTLGDFISGTDAFVHTWYDQAGSNDAVQATAANQPKIAESGALLDGIKFNAATDGTSPDFLQVATRLGLTTDHFVSVVFNGYQTDSSAFGSFLNTRNGNAGFQYGIASTDKVQAFYYAGAGNNANSSSNNTLPNNNPKRLVTFDKDGDTLTGFGNAATNGISISNAVNTPSTTVTNIGVGGNVGTTTSLGLRANINELIVYETDQADNRFKIESNINNYYGLYNDANEFASDETAFRFLNERSGGTSASSDLTQFTLDVQTASAYSGAKLSSDVLSGDAIYISFNCSFDSGSPSPKIALRDIDSALNGGVRSNEENVNEGFNSFILTSTSDTASGIVWSEGDDNVIFSVTDIKVSRIARNGFVETWYDQSGNDNDAVQATATEQPSVVKNGGIVKLNGKPSVNFDGVDNYFTFTSNFNFNLDPTSVSRPVNTIMFVGENTAGSRSFLGDEGSTKNWIAAPYNGTYQFRDNGSTIYDTTVSATLGSQLVLSIQCPSEDNFSIRENGSAKTLGGTNNITAAVGIRDIGVGYTLSGSANYQTMKAQEFYFHNERLTNDIVDIENDAINYYNIS